MDLTIINRPQTPLFPAIEDEPNPSIPEGLTSIEENIESGEGEKSPHVDDESRSKYEVDLKPDNSDVDREFWISTIAPMNRGLNENVSNCGYLTYPSDDEDDSYISKKKWESYMESLKEDIFCSRFGNRAERIEAFARLESPEYQEVTYDGHFRRVWNHCRMTLSDYVKMAKIYGRFYWTGQDSGESDEDSE